MYKIADAHCDLLGHLEYNQELGATPHDPEARCSLPQLRAGNVGLQVTAIFTVTGENSSQHGISQSLWFKKLLQDEADFVAKFPQNVSANIPFFRENKTFLVVAIENASGFWAENEPFSKGVQNLNQITQNAGKPLYISLTHHLENRFGGGNKTTVGLKKDGKVLLDYLSDKQIALDFAHASDALVADCLNHIDQNKLQIPVMASHSNLRKIYFHPRNLPTEFIQEILRRDGIIGLNWLNIYLNSPQQIAENLQVLVEEFKAENQVCSGADFFSTSNILSFKESLFFEGYENASDFPKLMQNLSDFGFSEDLLNRFAHQNLVNFIQKLAA